MGRMKRFVQIAKRDDFMSIISILVMVVVLTLTSSDIFWSSSNISSLSYTISRNVIVAFGMMMVMICGYFDLSVGNIMLLSSLVSASVIQMGGTTIIAILAGLISGLLAGALNGLLVAVVGVNALIATIGTQYIFYGIGMTVYDYAKQVKLLPDSFIAVSSNKLLGVEYYVWCALILFIVFSIYMSYNKKGRQLYYIGGNKEAAKQMGYPFKKSLFTCYMILGLLAAVAGIFAMARIKNPSQNVGMDLHMTCIIACIVGGGSFAGGKGRMTGALFGIIFISLLSNMFNIWEVKSMYQNLTLGLVLVAVLTLDGWMNIKRLRSLGKI